MATYSPLSRFEMNSNIPKLKKILNLLGRFLTIAALGLLFLKLKDHFHEVSNFPNPLRVVVFIFIFSVCWLISSVTGAIAWRKLLRALGVNMSLKDTYVIMGLSQIGKYIPGNIFQYVGRAKIGGAYGITTDASIISMGMETMIAIITAMIVFVSGWNIMNPALYDTGIFSFLLSAKVWILGGGVLIVGFLLIFFSGKVRELFLKYKPYLKARPIIVAALADLVFFFAVGIIIAGMRYTILPDGPNLSWNQFASGFAISWILGFIVPGAPGGIGIREVVFVSLFGPQIGDGIAVSLALLLRIITTLSDLWNFLIAFILNKTGKNFS
ncbi:MAG: lysylphosphatidylglycerol synthase domain-containing protein [Bacteroidota bacterium]